MTHLEFLIGARAGLLKRLAAIDAEFAREVIKGEGPMLRELRAWQDAEERLETQAIGATSDFAVTRAPIVPSARSWVSQVPSLQSRAYSVDPWVQPE